MKVMIVGAGKFGYRLAETMDKECIEVTIIDTNKEAIEHVRSHLKVMAITGNGLDSRLFRELDAGLFDMFVAATSSDETNTIACYLAKKHGVKKVVARIRKPENVRQKEYLMNDMGIDQVVNPDLATAQEMTRFLMKGYRFQSGDFERSKLVMMDIYANRMPGLIGKQVKELRRAENIQGLLIPAIKRNGQVLIPDGSTVIESEDLLYIIGKSPRVTEVLKRYRISVDTRQIKKVMILGGGKIGFFLARQLLRLGVQVKIIEQDRDRCMYLSTTLSDSIVIHGDGTDIQLLDDEDLPQMDAFIGVTGYDEHNLLMALMAKQEGVPIVISKVTKFGYLNLLGKLNIDFALNPTDTSIAEILKYARGGQIVAATMLLEGQAEVVEIIIHEDLACVGEKIKDLNLPKGLVIGAMIHNHQAVVPNGSTVLNVGDRLVIFCLNSNLDALQTFIRPNNGGLLRHIAIKMAEQSEIPEASLPMVSISQIKAAANIGDISDE
ncbi:MAG: Trk system potassium transporter TrkA [Acidaminobacter sp.]|nr:Trk system potassium transporter TrkA [Acidaminobacter sp.]